MNAFYDIVLSHNIKPGNIQKYYDPISKMTIYKISSLKTDDYNPEEFKKSIGLQIFLQNFVWNRMPL